MTGSATIAKYLTDLREAMRGTVRNDCRLLFDNLLTAAEKAASKERDALDKMADAGVDVTRAFRVAGPRKGKSMTDAEFMDAKRALIDAGWLTSPAEVKKGKVMYRLDFGRECGGAQRSTTGPRTR